MRRTPRPANQVARGLAREELGARCSSRGAPDDPAFQYAGGRHIDEMTLTITPKLARAADDAGAGHLERWQDARRDLVRLAARR
jgi:hypothetical protein